MTLTSVHKWISLCIKEDDILESRRATSETVHADVSSRQCAAAVRRRSERAVTVTVSWLLWSICARMCCVHVRAPLRIETGGQEAL